MSDINVVPQTEDILVAPANQLINVFNVPHEPVIIPQPIGVKLAASYPASWNSGMWLGGGDQTLYDLRIPNDMKIGDHLRLTHWGSLGDNTAGAAPWYYRVWIDGVDTTTTIYTYVTNPQSGGKRTAYKAEVDIMMQSVSSAWIQHRICETNSVVPGTSQIVTAEGTYHTLLNYRNMAKNLPGLGLMLTAQCGGGTSPGSSVHSRGLIVEHLRAP